MHTPKETFEILMNKDFKCPLEFKNRYKVKTEPKLVYNKWWHKIMYYITFKSRFVEGWTYEMETIK